MNLQEAAHLVCSIRKGGMKRQVSDEELAEIRSLKERCRRDNGFCTELAARLKVSPEDLRKETSRALQEIQSRQAETGTRGERWLNPPTQL
jgi:hypothetical protein